MASPPRFYFDAYTLEFWMMLSKVRPVVVPDACATFPVKLVDFISKGGINFIFWVPTIMVNIANRDLLAKADPSKITKVFFIGEVFPTNISTIGGGICRRRRSSISMVRSKLWWPALITSWIASLPTTKRFRLAFRCAIRRF